MNGRHMNKLLIFITFFILFQGIGLFPMTLWAGNKEHVEKRVEDLDHMNKDIVQGFPDIPQYGTIEYKAHVKEGESGPKVEILEQNIEIGQKTTKQEESNPNNSGTNK